MAAMRTADLGSPVAAPNSTLKETVVYVGDERGDLLAFDTANGLAIWSTSIAVGNSERSSPMIAPDGSVWTATAGSSPSSIVKVNGATGKTMCQLTAPLSMNSSIMLATPPGGVETIYSATNHTSMTSGTEFAATESNCAKGWSFNGWLTLSGAWATPAYGVDANGNGRVFIGTADPDSTEYALDASTGSEIWNYSALNPPDGEFDIGAAATVSPPGNNGFADGVVYFPSKYGVLYALDLTTGKLIWQFNFNSNASVNGGGRSAAALYKTELVYGMANGVEAVNALTGALLWHYTDPSGQEVLSSPSIAGPSGKEIVAFGDASGLFTVLSLSTGAVLYTYQTGNFITSSPAIIDGNILIASTDGFLYDFERGGANVAPPTTAITSPATKSKVPSPGSNITISGTATAPSGTTVSSVQLSVQRGGPNGPWLDAANGTWGAAAVNNVMAVASPGAAQSNWSFTFPVLGAGSSYQVTANAVTTGGQADRTGAQTTFTVEPTTNAPQLSVSSTLDPPASTFTVSGGPFAANETVDFSLQSGPVKAATASSTGMISNFPITVPATAAFGLTTLTGVGQTSGDASSTAVSIENIWTQSGYSALHTGFEPNDPILEDTLQATNQGYLTPAWIFNTGAEIDTAPIVSGGTAYVANSAGVLTALDTYAAAPLWTYTIPDAAPIVGDPAIGDSDIVMGGDDGNLYRIASSTGALIGTIALDGVPTAPALAGGTIYVGTDNGSVYAFSETSGDQLWKYSVGAAISVAPSIDTAKNLLFVGDESGHITELNPATGASIAKLTTGGAAVTVPPSISGGLVLVGASDGYIRAFKETATKVDWKYNTGDSIGALSSTGTDIYFGNSGGTIGKLIESNGSPSYLTQDNGSAVIGIAHSTGATITETAKGFINALKDDQKGRIQFDYSTGDDLDTQPVIDDGTVYVAAENGNLYAFTTHGQSPEDAVRHRFLAQVRAQTRVPRPWVNARNSPSSVRLTQAFAPYGPREFQVHIDRTEASAPGVLERAKAVAASREGLRTYLIGWGPVAVRANAYVERARAATGSVAGIAVDTTPYPRALDDAAVQREIARNVAAYGWHAGPGVRFIVLTAESPLSAHEYCSYHSAFDLDGALSAPVVYGVIPAGTMDECGPFRDQIVRESTELLTDPFVRNP
jgi:outer membrane protein assembly factor BamB